MRFTGSVAEEHAERAVGLEPFEAAYAGIAGHDHELAELSADGFAERAELDRSTCRDTAVLGKRLQCRGVRLSTGR